MEVSAGPDYCGVLENWNIDTWCIGPSSCVKLDVVFSWVALDLVNQISPVKHVRTRSIVVR